MTIDCFNTVVPRGVVPRGAAGRRLSVAVAVVSLAVLGPTIQLPMADPAWVPGAAWAQDVGATAAEISNYAAAVLEMDGPRTEAYNQIRTLLTGSGQDPSSIDLSCAGTANLNQLPRNLRNSVRGVVVDYCNRASSIVQSNGLTVRRFNAITAAHPQNPALAEQIRTAMIELQQSQNPRSAPGGPTE